MNTLNKNKLIDSIARYIFMAMTIISSSFTIILFAFLFVKGIKPFLPNYEYGMINFFEFLFGMVYRQDKGIYGIGFIIINTIITGFLSLIISLPISVLTSLFIVKIVPKKFGVMMRYVVDILSGVPSVVYGVFASGLITLMVKNIGYFLGIPTAGGNSMLSVIILLAIMIFPTITSMSITAITAVDKNLEMASLALGATKTQTNFKVVLLAAKSGIFSGAILGLGRAYGEATAVSMVAGNKLYGPTFNLFDITRTLTSTMLSGLKETSGVDYDIRFSIGLILLIVIFGSNIILNIAKRKIGK